MIDNEVIQAIEAILKRGNNAEVRRKGDGVIVLEVQKKIKYQSSVYSGTGKGNRSQLLTVYQWLAFVFQ